MNNRFLSISQLAEITGFDRRTVTSRLASIKPFKVERNAHIYDCHSALPLIYTAGDVESQMATESLLLEKAKREKAELEVARLRGEQVPIQDVCAVIEKEYSYVRATLHSIPTRRAVAIAFEPNPSVVSSMISENINEALAHLQADKTYSKFKEDLSDEDTSVISGDDSDS